MVKGLISLSRTWQYVYSISKPQDLDEPQRWIHSGWGLTISLQEEPYVCTYTVQWWQCSHNTYVYVHVSERPWPRPILSVPEQEDTHQAPLCGGDQRCPDKSCGGQRTRHSFPQGETTTAKKWNPDGIPAKHKHSMPVPGPSVGQVVGPAVNSQ